MCNIRRVCIIGYTNLIYNKKQASPDVFVTTASYIKVQVARKKNIG